MTLFLGFMISFIGFISGNGFMYMIQDSLLTEIKKLRMDWINLENRLSLQLFDIKTQQRLRTTDADIKEKYKMPSVQTTEHKFTK